MPSDIVKQLDPIFKAKSMAIIGASREPFKWGGRTLLTAMMNGYRGAIYPVNPREKEIHGLTCYPSVRDIPYDVDMAVIVIPAAASPQAMADCAAKGIKGVVMITAGFAEASEEGRVLQDELVRIAREGGVRFVGPNGMGIYSSAVNLNLCLHDDVKPGKIAFVSQSGTFGGLLAEFAERKGYGLSKFISIGNQADLNAADYVEYLGEDDDTGAIVLYMEGFKDGDRFFKVAREAIKRKPILMYKAGRTEAAARATMSHTSSLAGSDEIVDAMCRQVGIIRTSEVTHPFDMAEALIGLPLPRSNRVAIIGSGGQGVVTSDTCESLGLRVPALDHETRMKIKETLPPHAPVPSNPVDFAGGMRGPLDEVQVADALAQVDYIDGIICNTPHFHGDDNSDEVKMAVRGAEILAAIPKKYGKPVVTLSWHSHIGGGAIGDIMKAAGIPSYETPEQCARAMMALAQYADVRQKLAKDQDISRFC
ncbi:MAG TPA: acetyl-CoA synthetase [Dehalococcoidia bacterium]|nr:acetyl-CoA synthetase [Dehalococcoidia bacterium]